MKPPQRPKTEYEHIPKYDEWISGEIADIEYDQEHKKMFQGEEKIGPAVRFKFTLEGCSFPHRSRWLTFSYGEKSNLYKQFLSHLIKDVEPDMDFDLDILKGLKIKTMWARKDEYENLEMIRPLGEKIAVPPSVEAEEVSF